MSDVIVRDCTLDDVPAIWRIYVHYVQNSHTNFEKRAPTLDEMQKRILDIIENERGYPFLVAEYDGKVVGYGNLHAYNGRGAYRDTAEDTIYLDHNQTGRGIGIKLMQTLIEEAEKRDFRQLVGIVGGRDNTASIQLHKKCGFKEVGVLESAGYKHGRWIEVLFLQRSVGKGDSTPPDSRQSIDRSINKSIVNQ